MNQSDQSRTEGIRTWLERVKSRTETGFWKVLRIWVRENRPIHMTIGRVGNGTFLLRRTTYNKRRLHISGEQHGTGDNRHHANPLQGGGTVSAKPMTPPTTGISIQATLNAGITCMAVPRPKAT